VFTPPRTTNIILAVVSRVRAASGWLRLRATWLLPARQLSANPPATLSRVRGAELRGGEVCGHVAQELTYCSVPYSLT